MEKEKAIIARKLKKAFKDILAVDDVSFEVFNGEIYGFLGPNGAGKTTTLRMLTGILRPTSGEAEILGMNVFKNPLEVKAKIGVVPDEPSIYENLTGQEFLEFIGSIFSMKKSDMNQRISELCKAFDVNFLEKFIGDYSHGMRQKLMLVSVLMRKPRVLFLDEPTVGLDAKSAKILKMLLRKYANEGAAIFMTTHVLEIAEKMCDRIGIIDKGKLIAEGTLEELRGKAKKESLEDIFLSLTGEDEIKEIVNNL
ncbi:ABC transporter ATP-binding protein [Mesoaciditoga lauensis]|uniref:ABC transporter ATP-binding protein n=1 Tax=Mesoaciditoga lauensis TaxID=1495039 RepID=UPI00056CF2A4|nr:ABC transporter ATP-binding protein [Mesoaciditoga lauensis]